MVLLEGVRGVGPGRMAGLHLPSVVNWSPPPPFKSCHNTMYKEASNSTFLLKLSSALPFVWEGAYPPPTLTYLGMYLPYVFVTTIQWIAVYSLHNNIIDIKVLSVTNA